MMQTLNKVYPRLLGIIGGLSWHSTLEYYRRLNELYASESDKPHRSAPIVLFSHDFDLVASCQESGDWSLLTRVIVDSAKSLQKAGATSIVIASNTIHKLVPQIEAQCKIPILHLADAVGEYCKRHQIDCIGLLGTKPTMEESFYCDRLRDHHQLRVLTPDQDERQWLHRRIFNELVCGQIHEEDKVRFRNLAVSLQKQGAQSILLACTELYLWVEPEDRSIPWLDTLQIHVEKAHAYLKGG